MSALTRTTSTPDDTRAIGARIGEKAEAGDVVCLFGDLGAGKTTLTQGIAVGLGLGEDNAVASPTFTIVAEHRGGRLPLFHLDVYRLGGEADLPDIGYEDCLAGGGLTVIEWPERIPDALPADRLDIVLAFDPNPPLLSKEGAGGWSVDSDASFRTVTLTPTGPRSRRLLEDLAL